MFRTQVMEHFRVHLLRWESMRFCFIHSVDIVHFTKVSCCDMLMLAVIQTTNFRFFLHPHGKQVWSTCCELTTTFGTHVPMDHKSIFCRVSEIKEKVLSCLSKVCCKSTPLIREYWTEKISF